MRLEISQKIADGQDPRAVNLVNLAILDDEISEIMEHIRTVKSGAVKINFDMNKISDVGAVALSEALCNFSDLEEISIQYNSIDRKGAVALFSLKNSFPKLEILFHGNQIKDTGEMNEIERIACPKSKGLKS